MSKIKNRGVILGQRSTDWIAGGNSQIVYEVRNESGNWLPYLPVGEVQHTSSTDLKDCVTRSLLNSVEIQHKLLTGKEVNHSDRKLAKESGTTHQGNYLWMVADTARLTGLGLEQDWPTIDNMTWEDYYADIPQWVKDKAKKWLNEWDLKYEWIEDVTPENLIKHLKQAPLQVVIPGHAVVMISWEGNGFKYFDSYKPFVKEWKGLPQAVLKPVLTRKNIMMTLARDINNVDKVYALIEGPIKQKIWIPNPETLNAGIVANLWLGWSDVETKDLSGYTEGVIQISISK